MVFCTRIYVQKHDDKEGQPDNMLFNLVSQDVNIHSTNNRDSRGYSQIKKGRHSQIKIRKKCNLYKNDEYIQYVIWFKVKNISGV